MTFSAHIVAIIPAFNEESTICSVIENTRKYCNVIVVDDGSTDNTAEMLRLSDAFVVSHPSNYGYDKALESGLISAFSQGYTYAVIVDADGQHDPSLILKYENLLNSGCDVVIGTRSDMQRWSEYIFSYISRFVWRIHDPLCGMKAYRLCILKSLRYINSYASIGTELSFRASKLGLSIYEVDIPTKTRQGASRFGSGFKVNCSIVRALLIGLFKHIFSTRS